jgi:hypothetical protein
MEFIQVNCKLMTTQNYDMDIYSNFTYNFQNLEAPRCLSAHEWMNKLVPPDNDISLSTKKQAIESPKGMKKL